jgi:hypothetical protein
MADKKSVADGGATWQSIFGCYTLSFLGQMGTGEMQALRAGWTRRDPQERVHGNTIGSTFATLAKATLGKQERTHGASI